MENKTYTRYLQQHPRMCVSRFAGFQPGQVKILSRDETYVPGKFSASNAPTQIKVQVANVRQNPCPKSYSAQHEALQSRRRRQREERARRDTAGKSSSDGGGDSSTATEPARAGSDPRQD